MWYPGTIVSIPDLCHLSYLYCPLAGEGRKRSQISIANSSDYTLKIVEPDIVDLNGSLKMPSGAIEPCLLKKLADNHVGKYPTVTELFLEQLQSVSDFSENPFVPRAHMAQVASGVSQCAHTGKPV